MGYAISRVRVPALICACFLLGSTGWLAWLRQIMQLADPAQVDFYTMVVGYLAQVLGIGAYMAIARNAGRRMRVRAAVAALVVYAVLLDPAIMSSSLTATLAFGWLMNVFCGVTQGFYLECLAALVKPRRRGVAFGGGYAVSTALSWLLSSLGGGVAATGVPCLVVCAVLAVASAALALSCARMEEGAVAAKAPGGKDGQAGSGDASSAGEGSGDSPENARAIAGSVPDAAPKSRGVPLAGRLAPLPEGALTLPVIAFACLTVALISLVKNAGFSFPTEDLSGMVDLELSRLFYGVGLLVAGIAADRDRRYALACCAVSLAVPFLMLALSGAGASGVVLWAVGYLLFGFFVVFRVTLFADIASQSGMLWLAGAGLAFGRIGDVGGTALCLLLAESPIALIVVTAVLFAASMALLFVLHQRFYAASPQVAVPSAPERDFAGEFGVRYGLSAREREVLPLLVEGKTNAEIAASLFVTESTVKYHVRNIREKTDCKTRLEVADLFVAFKGQPRDR